MKNLKLHTGEDLLLTEIRSVLRNARNQLQQTINQTMVNAYWNGNCRARTTRAK